MTLVSYYNYHQNIAYPDEPPFWVRIGGLPFTGDIHQVHEDFIFQEKYWDSYTKQEKIQEETLNQLENEINDLEIEKEDNTHFLIDPENPDRLYFNIVVTPSKSDPSEISDLVEKTEIFGEVDAKESVLEDQRSAENQTQQALIQKVVAQGDSVSYSRASDLNKSSRDFLYIQSASQSPFADNKDSKYLSSLQSQTRLFNYLSKLSQSSRDKAIQS